MKKATFAKLFELEDTQVLITKELDKERGFLIRARVNMNGEDISFNHGYKDIEQRNKAFLETTKADAVMLKRAAIEHLMEVVLISDADDKVIETIPLEMETGTGKIIKIYERN